MRALLFYLAACAVLLVGAMIFKHLPLLHSGLMACVLLASLIALGIFIGRKQD